ncbi:MAG: lipopolysaccharide biosynthesis protein, partial [Acidobacteria bacterium]|nr:lipopolysaccharide biosynthesis protein [Acidobacteriota bacterium]
MVVRLLSPSDYGLFGFAILVSDLSELIAELGLGAAIIQMKHLDEAELETVFWLSVAGAAGMYAVIWLAAPAIAMFFNQRQLTAVLRVSMVTFLISSVRIVSWNLLTKHVDFKRRSVADGVATVVGSITILAFAYGGWGVWALVAGLLLRETVLTLSCYWVLPWRPRGQFSRKAVRRVFGFGARTSGGRIAWYFSSNADFLIVGKLLGQQALGFYSLVFQLATLPADRITSIVKQVAFPVYAQLQDQPESFKRFFLKTITLISLITFPLMTGLVAVADVAVPALLTAKWQPIVVPLRIMCGMGMVLSISALIAPAVLA